MRTKIHDTSEHQQRAEQHAEQRRDEDERHGLERCPLAISDPVPALATAAPTSPPISACDEDDGMPYYQVMRFQAIAPISAPNTT